MVFSLGLASQGSRTPIYSGVAALSGHCLHMERKVFVCYWKHWHVCNRLDDTFSVLVL
jgi:hypothetical protein